MSKILVITAPSGSGKTTLIRNMMDIFPQLAFSVSACTRQPRNGEVHGKDYYFFSPETFRELIKDDAFIEWEMVYEGKYYGTLRTELERIWLEGKTPVVDIDVKGALAVQQQYPYNSKTIFIQAPSLEELRNRLTKRGTETPESLQERLDKAAYELSFAPRFDKIIVNDDFNLAAEELRQAITDFLEPKA